MLAAFPKRVTFLSTNEVVELVEEKPIETLKRLSYSQRGKTTKTIKEKLMPQMETYIYTEAPAPDGYVSQKIGTKIPIDMKYLLHLKSYNLVKFN